MNRSTIIVFVALILFTLGANSLQSAATDPKPVQCQKFRVTFALTYNGVTLAEAARLELVVRRMFPDAGKVGVTVSDIGLPTDPDLPWRYKTYEVPPEWWMPSPK